MHNKFKHYLFIDIYIHCIVYVLVEVSIHIAISIAETSKPTIIIQFQHVAFMFAESDINRTMKSKVNKRVNEPCHASNKPTGEMKWFQFKLN